MPHAPTADKASSRQVAASTEICSTDDQPPPRSAWSSRAALSTLCLPTAPLLAEPSSLPIPAGWLLVIGLGLMLAASLVVHALQKFSPALILLRKNGRNAPSSTSSSEASRGEEAFSELEAELQGAEVYQPAAVLVELLGLSIAAVGALALQDGATLWPRGWPGLGLFMFLLALLDRLLPEKVTEHRAESIVLRTLPVLRVLRTLLLPLSIPLVLLTRFCTRNILGIRDEVELQQDREQLADEIRAAVEDSDDSEELADEEKAWIENIVEFRKEDAAGIMTPRTDMVCIEASSSFRAAMRKGVEEGHSRLPVFEDKLDTIIGIFYLRDAVALLAEGSSEMLERPVREHIRDPYFVPESKRVSNLLREFREMRVQIAIVVDEYGGTSGLVSIEDILEEIVGEIEDEYDPREDDQPLEIKDDGRWAECDAKTRVSDLNEKLAAELPESEDYETLGGFLASQLGRIGKKDEVIRWENVEITVLEADARHVERVRLRVLEAEAKAG